MPRQAGRGFSLVVMAALFVAFSVIVAAVIEHNNDTRQMSRQMATYQQLQRLANAILQYSVFHGNVYPCPARYDVLTTDVGATPGDNFGQETPMSSIANGPTCSTVPLGQGSPPIPGVNTILGVDTLNSGNYEVIRGIVPVTALAPYGIDITDAFDVWGDRIMYTVNRNLTTGGSGTVTATNFQVTNGDTGQPIANPDFVLVSYGRDRLGGIPELKTSASIPCPDAATVKRQINCDKNVDFYQKPSYTNSNAQDAGASEYSDDILVYYRQ